MVSLFTLLTTMILALMSLLYSMGGSVAVHVAAKKVLSSLCGLVVVDVVEVRFTFFLFFSRNTLLHMASQCYIEAVLTVNKNFRERRWLP